MALLTASCASKSGTSGPSWSQWGQDAAHLGVLPVAGQRLDAIHFDYVYDPFVATEIRKARARRLTT